MSLQNSHQVSDVKVMLVKGADGEGIESIEKTSTVGLVDTYTITYGGGKKATFTVTNASDLVPYNSFNVEDSAWVSNPDPNTSTNYPYMATISTTLFTADAHPVWQMNGTGDLPTSAEMVSIQMVVVALFDTTGITLYATDQPTVDLVLEVRGDK